MEEADFLCDEITIIDNGAPIASGTSSRLKEMAENSWFYEIEVAGKAEEYAKAFAQLPFIESASLQDGLIQVCLRRKEAWSPGGTD